MEDPGDYRLGTIEMMNSPYCIVAYVEAKNPMDIYCVGVWNNKRWRQLIMITPELMVGNKQYPYFNDYLQGTAMKWVRELANPTGVFGPYDDLTIQMQNSRYNTIGTRRVYINLWFDYMYNDIYDYRMAFIKSNFTDDNIVINNFIFTNESILVSSKSKTRTGSSTIKYEWIIKACESKDAFYLFVNKQGGLIITKSEITEGNEDQLRAFLSSKISAQCNKLKKVKNK
jgi:hypothetical protein